MWADGVALRHSGVTHLRRHTIGHGHAGLAIGSVSRSDLLHHLLRRVSHHRSATHSWHHAWLSGVSVHGTVRVHGVHVRLSTWWHATGVSDTLALTLLHLGFEGLSTNVLTLSESHVERFGADHLAIHLLDGLGGFVGVGIADETEVLGSSQLDCQTMGGFVD